MFMRSKLKLWFTINKHKEEAFTFLDYFMSEEISLNSIITVPFTPNLPLFSDAYSKESPYQQRCLTPEAFEELTETKEQITAVSFDDEISSELSFLIINCREAYIAGAPYEEMVHEAYEQMQRKVRE
jgi:ABC-type glycerol-3-phosphate transport system substrate-binding protein